MRRKAVRGQDVLALHGYTGFDGSDSHLDLAAELRIGRCRPVDLRKRVAA